MKIFFLLLSLSFNLFAREEASYKLDDKSYLYQKPRRFDFITTAPKNYGQFLDSSFSKESLKGWGLIAAATGTLMIYDEKILNKAQLIGRKIGFGNHDNSRSTFFIGDESLMYAPTDVPSAITFLGDGWVSLGISTGFLGAGLICDDPRALQTASQIVQGMLMTGVSAQALKRIAGKEEPNTRTSKRGHWRPLPSRNDYANHKTKYDSFPSAHLATAMTTFTIVSRNYSDYSFIDPLGYTLLGLLSFQLLNSGVHWASDMPLALGMGYMIGRTLSDSGRIAQNEKSTMQLMPHLSPDGKIGASLEIYY